MNPMTTFTLIFMTFLFGCQPLMQANAHDEYHLNKGIIVLPLGPEAPDWSLMVGRMCIRVDEIISDHEIDQQGQVCFDSNSIVNIWLRLPEQHTRIPVDSINLDMNTILINHGPNHTH